MIDYRNSSLMQILPEALCSPEAEALAFAIQGPVKKIMDYVEQIRVYASINHLRDEELDLLALELQAQYYSDSLDINTKRRIVQNAMKWHYTAGTPAAVQELIESVFGEGSVREWWEYGGKPYLFRARAEAPLTENSINDFVRIIQRVKNTRSHLEALEVFRKEILKLYLGGAAYWKVKRQVIEDTFTGITVQGQALKYACRVKGINRMIIREER